MGEPNTAVMQPSAPSKKPHKRTRSSQVKYEKEEAHTHATAFFVLLLIVGTVVLGEFYLYPKILASYTSQSATSQQLATTTDQASKSTIDLDAVPSIEIKSAPEDATQTIEEEDGLQSELSLPSLFGSN